MSGSLIIEALEVAVDSVAEVVEAGGAQEASTLSSQISAFGAGIEGMAAAAEENPALALLGLAVGVTAAVYAGPVLLER